MCKCASKNRASRRHARGECACTRSACVHTECVRACVYAARAGCVLNVREIVRAVRTSVQCALRKDVLVCMSSCVLNSELRAC